MFYVEHSISEREKKVLSFERWKTVVRSRRLCAIMNDGSLQGEPLLASCSMPQWQHNAEGVASHIHSRQFESKANFFCGAHIHIDSISNNCSDIMCEEVHN